MPVAAAWIADTQRERKTLERQLGTAVGGEGLSSEQVKALVASLRDIVQVLADAEPADKAELYAQLGISLAYDPDGTVTVESHPRGLTVLLWCHSSLDTRSWRDGEGKDADEGGVPGEDEPVVVPVAAVSRSDSGG